MSDSTRKVWIAQAMEVDGRTYPPGSIVEVPQDKPEPPAGQPRPTEVTVVPTRVDGLVARAVSDGKVVWVETWWPDGWAWSDEVSLYEVLTGPPASAALMDRLGIPEAERAGEGPLPARQEKARRA